MGKTFGAQCWSGFSDSQSWELVECSYLTSSKVGETFAAWYELFRVLDKFPHRSKGVPQQLPELVPLRGLKPIAGNVTSYSSVNIVHQRWKRSDQEVFRLQVPGTWPVELSDS